jgi:translation initiation factor IF-1
MKRLRIGLTATVLICMLAVPGAAAGPDGGENQGFTVVEVSSVKEQVVAVDHAARTVTLKDESGNTRTVKVSNAVKNFNRVATGDVVTIETNETIAVEVQPGPGATMNIGSESQASASPGAKPSGMRLIEGKLKTRVESIDYEARTIMFKNRKGVLTTYKIGPQAKRFDEIRKGDMLVIEYSQTVAVSVK